jgi:hypothetical protein
VDTTDVEVTVASGEQMSRLTIELESRKVTAKVVSNSGFTLSEVEIQIMPLLSVELTQRLAYKAGKLAVKLYAAGVPK